jgi:hypothetical protein
MSKEYGIQKCKQALKYLSSDKDLNSRLTKAFSEMRVMREEGRDGDLSTKNFKTLSRLADKHLKGKLDTKTQKDIAADLVSLCVEIIQENTIGAITKKQKPVSNKEK